MPRLRRLTWAVKGQVTGFLPVDDGKSLRLIGQFHPFSLVRSSVLLRCLVASIFLVFNKTKIYQNFPHRVVLSSHPQRVKTKHLCPLFDVAKATNFEVNV